LIFTEENNNKKEPWDLLVHLNNKSFTNKP